MSSSLIKRLYNRTLRPYTPRKIASFNGVPVRAVRLFDATDEYPEYEQALIAAVRENVSPGDDVVIVGGGRGVSSVVAARRAAPGGSVTAYEGSRERVDMARETLRLSRIGSEATVVHGVVGENVDVAGNATGAAVVSATDLPGCDVLVLDCEGAELGILAELASEPETLIVETHGYLDSSESAVRTKLDDRGYDVVARGVEIEHRGVFVLTAVPR